jgi:hypothetical protein
LIAVIFNVAGKQENGKKRKSFSSIHVTDSFTVDWVSRQRMGQVRVAFAESCANVKVLNISGVAP